MGGREAVAIACACLLGCYQAHPGAAGDAGVGAPAQEGDVSPAPPRDASEPMDATPVDADGTSPLDGTTPDASAERRDGGGDAGAPDAGAPDVGAPDAEAMDDTPVRAAFLADQSLGASPLSVLQLVAGEGADLVVHAGDFDYTDDPAAWDAQIDSVLGPTFPYLAAIGNHDVVQWTGPSGYQALLQARIDRIAGAACTGDLGVNSTCTYRGILFVLSGVGTYGADHEAYLDAALATDDVWRLCVWHKNQHDMQVGAKTDEVGWEAYQLCQKHGAPIFTGHEHSYSRTYTLTDVGNRDAFHGARGNPAELVIAPNSTAVFVSGLGGHSTRAFNGEVNPWWASIHTRDYQLSNGQLVGTAPTIEPGALFVDFRSDGDRYLARGYFKTVGGAIVDEFVMAVPH